MADTTWQLFEKVAGARREWMACFDAITDWVFVKSPDLTIVKANRAAAALFSRVPQQLIGCKAQELFGSEEAPPDDGLVLATIELGQPLSADLSDLPVPGEFHVATYPLRDDCGQVVAVVEYVRDVTAQKALERQIVQSARLAAVGELAAGVAHNFGNILMGVGGSLEVMLLTAERDGVAPRLVDRMRLMHRELMRGDDIVKRLLSFARGSAPTVRPVKPEDVLEGVVTLCQAHALSRHTEIAWDVSPGTPEMLADAAQLREVLTNLVLNALQATVSGGRVRVRACARDDSADEGGYLGLPGTRRIRAGAPLPEGPCVDLVVVDSGCGIAAGDLERVFTPFFSKRVDGSQGTGLGLCVSLSVVEAVGGCITIETCSGHGSAFTVTVRAATD